MVARASLSPPLTRRGVLGLAAAAVLAGCGGDEEPRRPADAAGRGRQRYAEDHPDQYGVLGLPDGEPVGLAVLVHGGFWSVPYGLELMEPLAADLHRRGWATWNIEYRRLGDGGGDPATFEDVAAAFDRVPDLDVPPGLPSVSIGHSAGGHLAVWAASRGRFTAGAEAAFVPDTTIALSGVLDLGTALRDRVGGGVVSDLLGAEAGTDPTDVQVTLALTDPVQLTPATGKVLAVHAADDVVVPQEQSVAYVRANDAALGDTELLVVPGGHFDLIDPGSAAWERVMERLG